MCLVLLLLGECVPCSTTVWWVGTLFYYCMVVMCLVLLLFGGCVPCSTTVMWPCALFNCCLFGVFCATTVWW